MLTSDFFRKARKFLMQCLELTIGLPVESYEICSRVTNRAKKFVKLQINSSRFAHLRVLQ